jgi:Domain of unknown function (DUF4423)
LYKRANGHFRYLGKKRSTNAEAKKYQSEMLNLSKKALETIDIKSRSHTSVVLNLDAIDLEAAIQYLAEHNEDFLSVFRQKRSQTTRPYALQVSFFPLGEREAKNEK